jgi:DNA polymerase III sliding clamp (beta) subunit (PCNA family)
MRPKLHLYNGHGSDYAVEITSPQQVIAIKYRLIDVLKEIFSIKDYHQNQVDTAEENLNRVSKYIDEEFPSISQLPPDDMYVDGMFNKKYLDYNSQPKSRKQSH